jgi:conserved oligomeric Golgi complex subunit 3
MIGMLSLPQTNPGTHAVLLKPIKANIAEAHGQIASLLEGEYTEEERTSIGLTLPDELARILEGLS